MSVVVHNGTRVSSRRWQTYDRLAKIFMVIWSVGAFFALAFLMRVMEGVGDYIDYNTSEIPPWDIYWLVVGVLIFIIFLALDRHARGARRDCLMSAVTENAHDVEAFKCLVFDKHFSDVEVQNVFWKMQNWLQEHETDWLTTTIKLLQPVLWYRADLWLKLANEVDKRRALKLQSLLDQIIQSNAAQATT